MTEWHVRWDNGEGQPKWLEDGEAADMEDAREFAFEAIADHLEQARLIDMVDNETIIDDLIDTADNQKATGRYSSDCPADDILWTKENGTYLVEYYDDEMFEEGDWDTIILDPSIDCEFTWKPPHTISHLL